jgi:hypothetical protein
MIVMNNIIIHLSRSLNKMAIAFTIISIIIPVISITGMCYCMGHMWLNRIYVRR